MAERRTLLLRREALGRLDDGDASRVRAGAGMQQSENPPCQLPLTIVGDKCEGSVVSHGSCVCGSPTLACG